MIKTQSDFQEFAHNYPKKVIETHNSLTYRFSNAFVASRECVVANAKIEAMKLPLVAIHSNDDDFFTVQSNETPDI